MTPKQADAVIRIGRPVTVRNEFYRETFTKTFVRRDRWNIFSDDGGVYDRGELVLVDTVAEHQARGKK